MVFPLFIAFDRRRLSISPFLTYWNVLEYFQLPRLNRVVRYLDNTLKNPQCLLFFVFVQNTNVFRVSDFGKGLLLERAFRFNMSEFGNKTEGVGTLS